MKAIILILFISLGFISCNEDIPTLKQKIFFEKHYLNYAWFPQSSGYLIDSLGNVLVFNWAEVSHQWFYPDSTGYVSNVNMDKNISYCQISTYHVPVDSLKLFVNKIIAASKGKITSQHVMADAGITTYSAFIYDAASSLYKQVVLKTDGDISTSNSAPKADEIYQWLRKIGN
jgi:hypothetical protein